MSAKILTVDDAIYMRTMLKKILEAEGFNTCEAGDGEAGLAAYEAEKPDLVLMDITMPEMGGIDGVKAIRLIDPDASIIMCSAMGQHSMVLNAIQAGAKGFIVKPFKADQIVKAIEKAMTRK